MIACVSTSYQKLADCQVHRVSDDSSFAASTGLRKEVSIEQLFPW